MNCCMKGSLGNQNGLLMASLNTEYIVKNLFLKWVFTFKDWLFTVFLWDSVNLKPSVLSLNKPTQP